MVFTSLFHRLFALLILVLLAACNQNSEITHSYVDPVLKKMDLQGVMVIGVSKKPAARKGFEDEFAKALRRHGVNAVASHTILPKHKAEPEEVIAAAKSANLDTIMITRYMGESTEEVYHPGTIYYGVTPAYGAPYHGGFGGYYYHAYEVAYEQPVWSSNVTHTLVSDLYVAETKGHLWQAVSETIQASSTKKVREDAIKGLIKDLKDQGLLD